jgi:hypothetical protein
MIDEIIYTLLFFVMSSCPINSLLMRSGICFIQQKLAEVQQAQTGPIVLMTLEDSDMDDDNEEEEEEEEEQQQHEQETAGGHPPTNTLL